jgi:hypothetical protein
VKAEEDQLDWSREEIVTKDKGGEGFPACSKEKEGKLDWSHLG